MDVHLRDLRYFVAVAEELHFTRAAERLHITQPTLTRQIRQLELQLRTQLLDRDHRTVRLTPAGKQLLAAGREILGHWQAAERAVIRAISDRQPRVDVWGQYQGWLEVIAEIAAADDQLVPHISMRRGNRAAVDALLADEIDLVLAISPDPRAARGAGLRSRVIRYDPCGLLVSREHPLAGRPSLTCAELTGQRIWHAPGTPPEIEAAVASLIGAFGAIPVREGINLGLPHALDVLSGDAKLGVVLSLGARLPPGSDSRVIPLTSPVPCYLWLAQWRHDDTSPLLARLLSQLVRQGREKGWLDFNPARQWLLGTATHS